MQVWRWLQRRIMFTESNYEVRLKAWNHVCRVIVEFVFREHFWTRFHLVLWFDFSIWIGFQSEWCYRVHIHGWSVLVVFVPCLDFEGPWAELLITAPLHDCAYSPMLVDPLGLCSQGLSRIFQTKPLLSITSLLGLHPLYLVNHSQFFVRLGSCWFF